MPPFYIGRSNTNKVKKGYRGTVTSKKYNSVWNEELKNNPELFETRILTTHRTAKEAAEKEEWFHKYFSVHKNTLYINQATGAGTFIADVSGNKNYWYGKPRSGEDNPMYGRTHSAESRAKMSKSGKGKHSHPKTEEFKQHIRTLYKGKTLEERFGYEKGIKTKRQMSERARNRSPEHQEKLNQAAKKRPRKTCEYCNIQCVVVNYNRWHGPNCKLAP